VAHLQKDGLMFIHPTQTRSLTPREAARIQSFPDTFVFPQAVTRCYPQIGNAVPPLVGKAVGLAIDEYLSQPHASDTVLAHMGSVLPSSREQAIRELEEFVESLFLKNITQMSRTEFLKAWWSVGYLHPHLHPDAALDNGKVVSRGTKRGASFVLEPVYVRSGWPVELIPVAQEARRRFESQLISDDDYYCSVAVMAGAMTGKQAVEIGDERGAKTT
jgi:DNA (cytosine-5)-methyltransferase 1